MLVLLLWKKKKKNEPDRVHHSQGDFYDGVVCGQLFDFVVALR